MQEEIEELKEEFAERLNSKDTQVTNRNVCIEQHMHLLNILVSTTDRGCFV